MRACRQISRLAVALVLLLAAGRAEAQQVDFSKVSRGGSDQLSWRWRGNGGQNNEPAEGQTGEALHRHSGRWGS